MVRPCFSCYIFDGVLLLFSARWFHLLLLLLLLPLVVILRSPPGSAASPVVVAIRRKTLFSRGPLFFFTGFAFFLYSRLSVPCWLFFFFSFLRPTPTLFPSILLLATLLCFFSSTSASSCTSFLPFAAELPLYIFLFFDIFSFPAILLFTSFCE